MAQTILIKRSTGSAAPAALGVGELAYSAGNHALHIGHAGGVHTWLLNDVETDLGLLETAVGVNAADILALQTSATNAVLTTDTSVATNSWVNTSVTLTGASNDTVATSLAVKSYIDNLDSDNVKTTDASVATFGFVLDEDTLVSDSATKLPTQQSVKAYVDNSVANAVVGGMTYEGGYDAATNAPNITDGSALKGQTYTVTVAGSFLSEAVEVGDVITVEVNSASTLADYTLIQRNTDHGVFALIASQGVASGVATLDANIEVVELPAGAAAAATDSVLLSDGTWTDTIDGGTF